VRIQPVNRKKISAQYEAGTNILRYDSAKVILVDGKEQLRVEFEDCKRIASENNLPLAEVYRTLERT